MISYNATKIVATLGPASASEPVLRAMVEAGLDVARLNFSHGVHEDHRRTYDLVRKVAADYDCHIAVLADLQGPKIRTGEMAGGQPAMLVDGAAVTITTEPVAGTAARFSTSYERLPCDVHVGDRILLDDGLVELAVEAVEPPQVHCRVESGGPVGEHKGINLPGVCVSAPGLTPKDREDVAFALDMGVDYVALSFIRRPEDVVELREYCRKLGHEVRIVAKIEKPEALQQIEAIIEAADAVMVARGDLGVELDPEDVPVWQKRIIMLCSRQGKPVITATQMLESMRTEPRPTRAEASDVANAIFDGTDAVMLSAETATGLYPVEAVTMMRRIATVAEREQRDWQHSGFAARGLGDGPQSVAKAVSCAATAIAEVVGARVLVAFTHTGSTALAASKRRPQVPIIACTPLEPTARRCSLYWGVQPKLVRTVNDTDEMVELTNQEITRLGLVEPGDRVVLTAGVPMGLPGGTNTVRVETIQ